MADFVINNPEGVSKACDAVCDKKKKLDKRTGHGELSRIAKDDIKLVLGCDSERDLTDPDKAVLVKCEMTMHSKNKAMQLDPAVLSFLNIDSQKTQPQGSTSVGKIVKDKEGNEFQVVGDIKFKGDTALPAMPKEEPKGLRERINRETYIETFDRRGSNSVESDLGDNKLDVNCKEFSHDSANRKTTLTECNVRLLRRVKPAGHTVPASQIQQQNVVKTPAPKDTGMDGQAQADDDANADDDTDT